MNKSDNESERVPVSLEIVWRALTALGHQRLWLRPPDERSVNTWLIVTWDGLTVAERIRARAPGGSPGMRTPSTPIRSGSSRTGWKSSPGCRCSGE